MTPRRRIFQSSRDQNHFKHSKIALMRKQQQTQLRHKKWNLRRLRKREKEKFFAFWSFPSMTLLQNSFFVTTFLLLFFCISVLHLKNFLFLFVVVSFFPLSLNLTYLNVVSLVVSIFFWSLTIFLSLSFHFSMSVCFPLSHLTTPIWIQSFCVHLATCLLFLPLFLALCVVVLSIQFFFSLFISFTQNIFSFPAYFQFYLSFCHVFYSSQFGSVFSLSVRLCCIKWILFTFPVRNLFTI